MAAPEDHYRMAKFLADALEEAIEKQFSISPPISNSLYDLDLFLANFWRLEKNRSRSEAALKAIDDYFHQVETNYADFTNWPPSLPPKNTVEAIKSQIAGLQAAIRGNAEFENSLILAELLVGQLDQTLANWKP